MVYFDVDVFMFVFVVKNDIIGTLKVRLRGTEKQEAKEWQQVLTNSAPNALFNRLTMPLTNPCYHMITWTAVQ